VPPDSPIDIIIGTSSKSLGGAGGFIAGRKPLIDLLRNTARPFIFSTAPPAATAAATIAALKIIREEPDRRARLLSLCAKFLEKMAAAGLNSPLPRRGREGERGFPNSLPNPPTQIIPVILGSEQRALAAQQALLERDLFVLAIRPPTVPKGTSRLRISLMCDHTAADLDRLVAALKDVCV
jgi:7-keto-8-aminopelargonate synthetase-like enzyme